MNRIYLDHNASTPLDPRVLKVLIKELEEEEGNPSSIHFHGQRCRHALDESRQTIARFFQVKPHEVIFTSGGTEGAALLIQGVMAQHPTGHILSSAVEHACVYQTLQELEKKGASVTFLSTGSWGAVKPEEVERAIQPHTRLMTFMAANNETGVLTDLAAIAAIAQRHAIPLIVDGVAWLGKEFVHIPQGVSGVFFSGHKIYAPKGTGFCLCSSSLKLTPLFFGGHQEYQRRAGTENLPGIVALAEAIRLLQQEQEEAIARMRQLRDDFEQELKTHLADVWINGMGPRLSNTSNLAFLGVEGESLLMNLDMEGISVSHGSACSSGALEPSRILLAMDIPVKQALASIRFSIGKTTTKAQLQIATDALVRIVKRLRPRQRLSE